MLNLLLVALVLLLWSAPAAAAGAVGPPDASCASDQAGDSGSGQDIVAVCVASLRTGIALEVQYADPPSIDGPVAVSIGRARVEIDDTGGGLVATHSWAPITGPAGPAPPCGDFGAEVRATAVVVPYLPADCYDVFAPIDVTDPGGDTAAGRDAPPRSSEDVALPAGGDTVDVAIVWSTATFPDGGALRALLARDDTFADAMASAGLQAERHAPLLLTPTAGLDPRVEAELERLGTTSVTILGGEDAVGPAVADAVTARGISVERVSGETRLETALEIADRTDNHLPSSYFTPNATLLRAYPAEGGDPTAAFADTLALGTVASSRSYKPFLLTQTQVLSSATAAWFPPTEEEAVATLIGGEAAISGAVAAELESRGYQVDRIAGTTRFGTAAAIAARAPFVGAVVLLEGTTSDAWAAGFSAAAFTAPTFGVGLLAAGGELPQETFDALGAYEQRPQLVCGPGVSSGACAQAAAALDA